jgi:hypothetical protein
MGSLESGTGTVASDTQATTTGIFIQTAGNVCGV